jgi:UDP-GlcNAc:undecaprenyl-phosphate GlcNAc-1-phosphate transferase
MTSVAVVFLVALAASLALTPICRRAARRFGYVAPPKEDRWHKKPTALMGGVAIVVATLGAGLTTGARGPVAVLMAGSALIAALGILDDVLSLKASTKLIIQIIVASVLLLFGFRLHWTDSLIGDTMLTLFWIVGVTNAFNLLDNMDGLCAGTALVAGAFVLIRLLGDGSVTPAALYLAGLLGATAGFLIYNIYPASIFMGDTGSLFLGLNLAAITLIPKSDNTAPSGLLAVVVVPVLPLLVPIFDTALVTAMRLLSHRSPAQGGRDHSSHRLVAVGLSEPRAVAILWALGVAGGTISVLLQRHDSSWGSIAAVGFLLAMVIFGVYLARVRVYEEAHLAALQGDSLTPVIANFMYKRRVAEVLLDLCLISLAYYSAYRLRFEGEQFGANYPMFLQSLPIVIAAQLMGLFVMGGYRGTWRYFGMMDAVVFAKSVVLGTIAAQLAILYLYRFENYSRSVFVIYAIVMFLYVSATRASFRLVGEFVLRRRATGQRCVIYGTGGASLATIREAFGHDRPLRVLGYVEEDASRRHVRVGGYSVLGDHATLISMVHDDAVDCIVINTTLIDADRLQQLTSLCGDHEVELLRLHLHLKRLSAAS